jgi:hypothetical protein
MITMSQDTTLSGQHVSSKDIALPPSLVHTARVGFKNLDVRPEQEI